MNDLNTESELRETLGMDLKTNVVLRDYTSFKVGGVCDYFYIAKNIDNLVKSIDTALRLGIPYFLLGGGNNIVVSDIGFPGLVIKNESDNLVFMPGSAKVIVDSGVTMSKLLTESASRDLGGIEFLFGVPGTVGGAIYNNAGSSDLAIGDFVKFVTLLIPNSRTKSAKIVKYRSDWLNFKYRESRLKNEAKNDNLSHPKPVILTIKLQLVQSKREVILERMRKNLDLKKIKQPVNTSSAGSYFKNPGKLKEQTAGFLLEHVGAKRMKIGKATVSKKHANFIINKGGAKAEDIKRLAQLLKTKVQDEYRVNLEEEIEYIGRW